MGSSKEAAPKQLAPFMISAAAGIATHYAIKFHAMRDRAQGAEVQITEEKSRQVELQKECDELAELANRDTLTGLPNRRAFEKALGRRWAAKSRRPENDKDSLIFIDIDHFKKINDDEENGGHAEGDRVLKEVATLMEESTRKEDLVARYGGEEFVILAEDTNLDGAAALADNVRSHIKDNSKVTISAGVAPVDPSIPKEDSVTNADVALYAAKHGGRDRVEVYTPPPLADIA